MCGIVGAIADRDVVPVLIEGLKRLEYRGYDSAGIAVVEDRDVRRVRRTGRVSEMENAAIAENFNAHLGIGHTRWATHGGVTEANAHPHTSQGVALVHNGIIENHEEQRARLRELGYQFESQTDTEVIAHLMHHYLKQGNDLLAALQRTVKDLTGAYALAVVSRMEPDRMVCARMGCPLLVGLGDGENFVASDVSAILQATRGHVVGVHQQLVARLALHQALVVVHPRIVAAHVAAADQHQLARGRQRLGGEARQDRHQQFRRGLDGAGAGLQARRQVRPGL